MSEFSAEEKATFKAAGERRKARGVILRKFSVMADKSQVETLNILYDAWVQRFGKEQALDHLILMWGRAEARLCDRDEQKRKTGER